MHVCMQKLHRAVTHYDTKDLILIGKAYTKVQSVDIEVILHA